MTDTCINLSFLNDAERIADFNYEPTDGTCRCNCILAHSSLTDFTLADIVRARVRTFGVEEHKFVFENGTPGLPGMEGHHVIHNRLTLVQAPHQDQNGIFTMLVEAGACANIGCRISMMVRISHSLLCPNSYFNAVQAIIFLAPLAFNQVLEEDPHVNRLEDSIYLWKEVCASPLLAKSTLILFLNKARL